MKLSKPVLWIAIGLAVLGLAGTIYLLLPEQSDSVASGNAELSAYEAKGIKIKIATIPETPRVGKNRLVVELEDAEGDPITGINFTAAFAEMPAMGAMPAMRAPADMEETSPGRYEGVVDLSMRGEWPLTLAFETPDGEPVRLQFDLATDRPGLAIAGGARPVDGSGEEDSAANDQAAVITVDNRRRQMIGLETEQVRVRDLTRRIRAVGEVTYDERRLSEITLKFDGYIGDLRADYVGAKVQEGQVLFTVYSPELLAAQQEYLEIQRRGDTQGPLLQAVRQRLLLWDMSPADIEKLERRGTPEPYIAIHAPRTGTVIELNASDGGAAARGTTLMKIADLSAVWVDAQVYEADLSLLREGMPAAIRLPYLPGHHYEAEVEYIYPFLSDETRTGRVRMTLDNEAGELKPAMYAEVSLQVDLEDRLTVPEEAVLVAGTSRVVFLDLGQGRLQAVRIETGRRAQGYIEVLDGLEAGDTVVSSGNFLIAAETRLKTGIEQW